MVTKLGLLRRDRDFRRLWGGHTISQVGTQTTAVALPLVAALSLDAGPGGVSVVATATFLPNIVLPLFAGQWLERRRRRGVMIGTDLLRAAAICVVPIAYALDALSLALLAATAFMVGLAGVFFDVAAFAYLPELVDDIDLPAANRAMQGSTTAAQVAGPGVGGILVQLLGPPAALLADAASYLASALGVAAVRRPEAPVAADQARPRLLEGLHQLRVNPFLRALTTHAALCNAAAQILLVNLVVLAVKDRGLSAGGYGLALSAAGAGALVGTMLALRVADRRGYGPAFATFLFLYTGVPMLLPAVPFEGAAFGLALGLIQGVAGVGLGAANVLSVTVRQLLVPRESMARSLGAYRTVIYGVIPVGSALGGLVGAVAGARAGVAVGAVGLAASAVPMFRREIRRLGDPRAVAGLAAEPSEFDLK